MEPLSRDPMGPYTNPLPEVCAIYANINHLSLLDVLAHAAESCSAMSRHFARCYSEVWWLTTAGCVLVVDHLASALSDGKINPAAARGRH